MISGVEEEKMSSSAELSREYVSLSVSLELARSDSSSADDAGL